MNSVVSFIRLRSVLAVLCLALGFTAGILAAESGPRAIVTAFAEAKFVPINPAHPEVAQTAVLRGDPKTGPSTMLMKFGKGPSPMHTHSSDYGLVMLKGTMTHVQAGESERDAKQLGPGSYWFQPGKQAHADDCLSDECLMYVQWSGKRDSRAAK